ncbi:hypothetical protein N7468_009387 [Penicillium chermesinum]|uniref:Uncharacterized protein n=1 Tax=Penicillium chermesinum TaxID=63820 RepID=A0A9W9NI32_9EURO|nr:uncharacterized protein N7468_009387 [Penicillium chermesinum]KAJ5220183.1 hypothetical protein N7468_009387 [Penicillium chermesinum]
MTIRPAKQLNFGISIGCPGEYEIAKPGEPSALSVAAFSLSVSARNSPHSARLPALLAVYCPGPADVKPGKQHGTLINKSRDPWGV